MYLISGDRRFHARGVATVNTRFPKAFVAVRGCTEGCAWTQIN